MKRKRFFYVSGVLLLASAGNLEPSRGSAVAGAPLGGSNQQPRGAESDSPGMKLREPVVFRGWEIVSVSAVRRAAVTEVFPEYQNKRRIGDRRTLRAAWRGEFLIVHLEYKWAFPVSPSDPLWNGQPDVTLVAEDRTEYPCLGGLSRQAGEYLTVSMVTSSVRSRVTHAEQTQRALVYFEVPIDRGKCQLRFTEAALAAGVDQVGDLAPGDIPLPE